jgi:hypothetical protein
VKVIAPPRTLAVGALRPHVEDAAAVRVLESAAGSGVRATAVSRDGVGQQDGFADGCAGR